MRIKDIEVKILRNDITQLDVDAIVVAANSRLTMEGGLAAFIKKEGGPAIEEEAMSKGPVAQGTVVKTKAGGLKTKYILHAVIQEGDEPAQEEVLRKAVACALRCAKEHHMRSLMFPALNCDNGEFSPIGAAKIMVQEVMKCARDPQMTVREVVFCLYDEETFRTFDRTIRGYISHMINDLGFGPYATVDIIIEYEGGVILVERSNPPYGWALPGGFVEYGESLEQAAVRGVKEETNLDLADLRQFHTYSAPGRDPRFHTISTIFIADGIGKPIPGDDAANVKIVRYEDLLQGNYAFDHKEILEEYLVEKDLD